MQRYHRRKTEKAAPKALPSRNCEHVHAKTANTPVWGVRSCSCSVHRLGSGEALREGFTR
jgi:hypothetical protein